MKTILAIFALFILNFPNSTVRDFHVKTVDGKEFDWKSTRGKLLLIVNTASECGHTPQYEGLEKLYEKYHDKLTILAFPANNFGSQEPGTNKEIAEFCTSKYKISFPVMSKISVKGDDIDPLFKWLITEPNPDFTGDIKWNFEKFLIDRDGKLIRRFRTRTEPQDSILVHAIELN